MYKTSLNRNILEKAIKMVTPEKVFDSSVLGCIEGEGLVRRFEEEFSSEVGAKYALAVPSGTAALHASLMAADVGPGDEVIVSGYGWGQTVGAVLRTGAIPVFADIEKTTGNLNPQAAESLISSRTRAILVTHTFGLPADMLALTNICNKHNLLLIADAAQALGAFYDTNPVGCWGDIACFSLGRGKAITTGEGGVVVTSDPDLFERMVLATQHPIRALRDIEHAGLRRSVTEFGESYRLSSLAAALGLLQLPTLRERIIQRRRAAKNLMDVALQDGLSLPDDIGFSMHAFHTLVAVVEPDSCYSRDEHMDMLERRNLNPISGPVRRPLHLRFPFSFCEPGWLPKSLVPHTTHRTWSENSCPIAERRCREEEILLQIPSHMINP